jgi:opacity protein-like surface antigen
VRNSGTDRIPPTHAAVRAAWWGTRFALCLQIVVLFAAAAEAQKVQPVRPYRGGLFGENPKGQQPIDFTMSLTEGYDSNGSDELPVDSLNVPFRRAGLYSNLDSALRYTRGRRARRLTVTAGSALRYTPAPYQLLSTNYQGGVAFSSPVWRGGRLDVSQSAAYTPYYQFDVFPAISLEAAEAPKGPSSDYAIWKQPAYTYTSGIQFLQQFSARSSLRLEYARRSVLVSGHATDLLTQNAGIRFTHRFTRYAGFHAGIGSGVAQFGPASGVVNRIRTHDIDIGLDYDRPISFSRRTTLSFSSGSSLIPQSGTMHYHLIGNASLTHEIARTWKTSLQYGRALQFVEAFPQPLLSDSITAGIKGNPSRRVDMTFSGSYSAGQIGVSAAGGTFGTYTGSAHIGISVNRHFALYSEYLYYHYRLGQLTSVATAVPGQLDRQTARVGLKLWFPLLD